MRLLSNIAVAISLSLLLTEGASAHAPAAAPPTQAPADQQAIDIVAKRLCRGEPIVGTRIAIKRKCDTPQTAACQMSEVLGRCIQELQQRIDTLARLRSELSSTIATIRSCKDCHEPRFPAGCSDCDVTNRPDSSRTTELLWKN